MFFYQYQQQPLVWYTTNVTVIPGSGWKQKVIPSATGTLIIDAMKKPQTAGLLEEIEKMFERE